MRHQVTRFACSRFCLGQRDKTLEGLVFQFETPTTTSRFRVVDQDTYFARQSIGSFHLGRERRGVKGPPARGGGPFPVSLSIYSAIETSSRT